MMNKLEVRTQEVEPMETPAHSCRKLAKQYVRGFPFPAVQKFCRKKIESSLDYKPQEGDIFVISYPKSGTTWVQYIIYEILHGSATALPTMYEIERIIPYMEHEGAEAAMCLDPPRVLKCHVPYSLVPKSPHAKYIYIVRNPYDVAVSYFHFLRNIISFSLQFDEFLDDFVSGDLIYGEYFDHVISWHEKRNEPNVLMLSYDKMSRDPKKGLLKIARFLGDEYFSRLSKDKALVKKILDRTGFNFMKKQLGVANEDVEKNGAQSTAMTNNGIDPATFFRSGTVGDYRNHVTPQQEEKMNKWIAEKPSRTEIEKYWQI